MIEGFWIKNYGPLKSIALGTCHLQTLVFDDEESASIDYRLGPVTLIVGKSDVGKSSLMDAFHFLADSLAVGIEDACLKRGGYQAICNQSSEGPISIGVNFRVPGQPTPITYAVNISATRNNTPKIDTEALVYRSSEPGGASAPVMLLQNFPKIIKHVVAREKTTPLQINTVKQTDSRHLGLSALGTFRDDYPDAALLKSYLENWYLSCYTPHDAWGLSPVVPQKHLHRRGDTLVGCVREMETKHRENFQRILDRVVEKLPGVEGLTLEKTESGRLLLFFRVKDCPEPLSAQRMSDGLLRLFAHLLLLEDTQPSPFVGMEEPENGLDQNLLDMYIESLIRQVVEQRKTQFFITTHSPNLVDRVRPESVWLFERDGGEIVVRRASDDPEIRQIMSSQHPLPEDWFSGGDFMSM